MVSCPHCNREISDAELAEGFCPHCRKILPEAEATMELPASTGNMSILAQAGMADAGITLEPIIPEDSLDPLHAETLPPGSESLTAIQPGSKKQPRAIQRAGAGQPASLLANAGSSTERYVIGKEVARGGMGAILSAVDRDLRREIAMKVMLGQQDEAHKLRFLEEAQVQGQLEHPNLVPVHELGLDAKGRLYFTMKMVRGRSLDQVLKGLQEGDKDLTREYTLSRLLNIITQVSNALSYAHSRGVIHRDIKPANIMLGDFGEVLLMDWGLARVGASEASRAMPRASAQAQGADQELAAMVSSFRSESDSDLTMDGTIMGSPLFMSPEQAEGRISEIDERSDIYSMGAILYQVLTLHTPVEGENVFELLNKVIQGRIPRPEERAPGRHIPRELSAIAMKALSLSKDDRYRNADAFKRDLELYLEGRAVSAKEDTAWETVVKLVKRNKGASIATGIAVVVLTVVITIALWVNVQARKEAEANLAAFKAEQAAKQKLKQKMIAEAARDWRLVFEEDFSDPALARKRWIMSKDFYAVLQGKKARNTQNWEIRDGQLHMRGNAQQLLVLNIKGLQAIAKGDIRLEFECTQKGDILNDITCILSNRIFQCAGNYNRFDSIKDGKRYLVRQATVCPIQKGKHYHARAEIEGSTLRYFVNNKLILETEDQTLVTRARTGTVIVYGYSGEGWYDNIKVYVKGVARKTDVMIIAQEHLKQGLWQAARNLFVEVLAVAQTPERKQEARKGIRIATNAIESAKLLPEYRARLGQAWPGASVKLDIDPQTGLLKLVVRNGGISSLKPVAGMRIYSLDCSNNPVKSLEPLRSMSSLRRLICDNCELTTLEPLRGMKLTQLNCGANNLTDLEPLRGMPLVRLSCGGNKLTSLEPLRGMKLEKLGCAGNNITSLEPLRGMKLTYLGCHENQLTSLEPLRGMKLKILHCQFNQITSLEPLRGMKLTNLICHGNKLTSLEPLRNMPLMYLNCDGNSITSLEPLRNMPLSSLWCADNLITNLEPLKNMPLYSLLCNNNRITSLEPLRGMKVTQLECSSNLITSLAPLKNLGLVDLNCGGNPLTTLAPLDTHVPKQFMFTCDTLPEKELQRVHDMWANQKNNQKLANLAATVLALRHQDWQALKNQAVRFRGHHYILIPRRVSWEQARDFAIKAGAHLVTAGNQEELEFVCKYFGRYVDFRGIWTGLFRKKTKLYWVTGENVDLTLSGLKAASANREWDGYGKADQTSWFIRPVHWCNKPHTYNNFIIEWDD